MWDEEDRYNTFAPPMGITQENHLEARLSDIHDELRYGVDRMDHNMVQLHKMVRVVGFLTAVQTFILLLTLIF